MIRRMTFTLLTVASALLGAAPARAQYMFLDFDGDGQYSTVDQFGGYSYSDTAHVDLYVITNSPGTAGDACGEDRAGAGINGYSVLLTAEQAAMHVLRIENEMPGMSLLGTPVLSERAVSASYLGSTMYPAGKYRLLHLDLVFDPGCHALFIQPASCFAPGAETAIWSDCLGTQFDSVLRMGSDWVQADGSFGCTDWPPQTPSITCPEPVTTRVGVPITLRATVDAKSCGGVDSYSAYGVPGGVVGPLENQGYGLFTIPFTWTPGPDQTGVYSIGFEAVNFDRWNYRDLRAECTTTLTVLPGDRPPVADAGGPYRGVQFVPVPFDASHSSDPDGDALTYLWNYGDGATGSGSAPLHTYTAGGVFTVVLRATDPSGLFGISSTTATIARDIAVRVFTTTSNDPTRLGHGKPLTCFQIEATDASFTPDQIAPASVFLRYTDPVCGELDAYTTWPKAPAIGDTDRNGVLDYAACFTRDAMGTLGGCLPVGTQKVRLELYGSLTTGNRIHGTIEHTFISSGSLQAAILPNPVSAASTVEFTTKNAGSVRVRIFDIRGRLAATLYDEAFVPAGRHQVGFAALDRLGTRLASGVYFVRIWSEHDGEQTNRVTLLK